MVQRLNLTRDQLASFLQDHEQIKQFERLFAAVDQIDNVTIDEVRVDAGSAQATANDAIAQIISVASKLGTMSSQDSNNVSITGGSISGLAPPLNASSGGTGQNSYVNGELLIGNTTGNTLTKALLTAGANITITVGAGSIAIAVSGLGTMAFKNIGVSGSFTAASGEVITVTDGIITSIV